MRRRQEKERKRTVSTIMLSYLSCRRIYTRLRVNG